MSIYIQLKDGNIEFLNFQPFDEEHGLGKTKEELELTGIFVDAIPDYVSDLGESALLKYDAVTKEFFYEYAERALSTEEEIQLLKEAGKSASQKYSSMVGVNTVGIAELKIAKINELKELCTKAIYEGFSSTTGNEFGFNDLDQANFTQQSILVLINGLADTATLQWKSKTGVVTLTVAEFKTVITEAKDHKLAQQGKFWQLEGQALAATTKTAIEAVKW